MLRKNISVLAGSLLLAAGAQAAITSGASNCGSGGDSTAVVVLSSLGNGAYVYDTGISAGELASGIGLSIDISAAIAALGGVIDSFAVFGAMAGTSCVYSYAANYNYVDVNGGIVYAQTAPQPDSANLDLFNQTQLVRDYISAVTSAGYYAEGTAGDLDNNAIAAIWGLLNNTSGASNVYAQRLLDKEDSTSTTHLINILAPTGNQYGAYIEGNAFSVTTVCCGSIPPQVSITYPPLNTVLQEGEDIIVSVSASDSDGFVTHCDLSINNNFVSQDTSAPYQFSGSLLNNLAPGNYNLSVTCVDNEVEPRTVQRSFTVVSTDNPSVITGDITGAANQGESTSGFLSATDPDGLTDGSYFSIATPPVYGQAIINPTSGYWLYLADVNYVGSDPFTVNVTDDLDHVVPQVISITAIGIDTDGDTIYDSQDNCPAVSNVSQANLDGDALGDACDNDIDGDGTDNALDAFPEDPTENADTDSDLVGDNSDNCVNVFNVDQYDLDNDNIGDVCDNDIDGDGFNNVVENRFGGDENDGSDATLVLNSIELFSANALLDSDNDGMPDEIELAVGTDPQDSADAQSALDIFFAGIAKSVPTMGGAGLIVMFLSLMGLGTLRAKGRKTKP